MGAPDLWHRIHELCVRDIYVGLQLDNAGLEAWMTDRHYLRRAERYIEKGPELLMAQDLQRWLEVEAPKLLNRSSSIDYAQDTFGRSAIVRQGWGQSRLPTTSKRPG
jgi:hypothetical protein